MTTRDTTYDRNTAETTVSAQFVMPGEPLVRMPATLVGLATGPVAPYALTHAEAAALAEVERLSAELSGTGVPPDSVAVCELAARRLAVYAAVGERCLVAAEVHKAAPLKPVADACAALSAAHIDAGDEVLLFVRASVEGFVKGFLCELAERRGESPSFRLTEAEHVRHGEHCMTNRWAYMAGCRMTFVLTMDKRTRDANIERLYAVLGLKAPARIATPPEDA